MQVANRQPLIAETRDQSNASPWETCFSAGTSPVSISPPVLNTPSVYLTVTPYNFQRLTASLSNTHTAPCNLVGGYKLLRVTLYRTVRFQSKAHNANLLSSTQKLNSEKKINKYINKCLYPLTCWISFCRNTQVKKGPAKLFKCTLPGFNL